MKKVHKKQSSAFREREFKSRVKAETKGVTVAKVAAVPKKTKVCSSRKSKSSCNGKTSKVEAKKWFLRSFKTAMPNWYNLASKILNKPKTRSRLVAEPQIQAVATYLVDRWPYVHAGVYCMCSHADQRKSDLVLARTFQGVNTYSIWLEVNRVVSSCVEAHPSTVSIAGEVGSHLLGIAIFFWCYWYCQFFEVCTWKKKQNAYKLDVSEQLSILKPGNEKVTCETNDSGTKGKHGCVTMHALPIGVIVFF